MFFLPKQFLKALCIYCTFFVSVYGKSAPLPYRLPTINASTLFFSDSTSSKVALTSLTKNQLPTLFFPEICGDSIVDRDEQCDDGNTQNGDGCSSTCQFEQLQIELCGNKIIDDGEQCDDGNTQNGDGCSSTCQFENIEGAICGNKVVEGTEQCDDGNTQNGDGCSSTCQNEVEFCTLVPTSTNLVCNNLGTSNPNDDRWTYDLTITGSGIPSGSYWNLTGAGGGSGSYNVPKTIFAGLIEDGQQAYVVRDAINATCYTNFNVSPPKSCSAECTLDLQILGQSCNDQGTSNTSDDTVTYQLSVTGSGNLPWTIVRKLNSGGTAYAPVITGSTDGVFSSGPINVQQAVAGYPNQNGFVFWFMRDGYFDCVGDRWVFADTCSANDGTCEISGVNTTRACNDNGTTNDATDDFMTYSILVTGTNTSNTYRITGDHDAIDLAYGTTYNFGTFNPNQSLSLIVSDTSDKSCPTVPVTIPATGTCSPPPLCSIEAPYIQTQCNDNGTSGDANDDYYTFTINAGGVNTSTAYNMTNNSGLNFDGLIYLMTEGPLGNYTPGSTLLYTLTDVQNSSCSRSGSINFPASTCSTPATGSLLVNKILNQPPPGYNTNTTYSIVVDCSNNAFDQTLTLTAGNSQLISGIPTGTTCTISEPNVPNPPTGYVYDDPVISPTSVSIVANTQATATVTNALNAIPPPCSLNPPVLASTCNQNGTPSDASDDYFTYTISVSGNNTGNSYLVSGDDNRSNLPYNTLNGPFGNFPMGTNLDLSVSDTKDSSCNTNGTVQSPAACACTPPNVISPGVLTTCEDPIAPLHVVNFSPTDRFDFTVGQTNGYTGSATYATATPIPSSGIITTVNNNNPQGIFSIRIFNAGGCYQDLYATHITTVDCQNCTTPNFTFAAVTPYCETNQTYGGYTLSITGNADRFEITNDPNFTFNYDNAQAVTLPYPFDTAVLGPINSAGETYQLRVYNGGNSCFIDQTIQLPALNCDFNCTSSNFSLTNPVAPGCDTPNSGSVQLVNYGNAQFYTITQGGITSVQQPIPSNGQIIGLTAGTATITLYEGGIEGSCQNSQSIAIPTRDCTSACIMSEPQTVSYCNTNGTPNNPADDLFGYTVNANATFINVQIFTGTYNVSGDDQQIGLPYGTPQGVFGWFPLSMGQLNLTLTDTDFGNTCTENTTVVAPDDCTYCTDPSGICVFVDPVCALQTLTTSTTCNDNGTPNNSSDDIFSYTINVSKSGTNTNPTYQISGDDTRSNLNYNTSYTFGGSGGSFPISGGALDLVISDTALPNCSITRTLNAPPTCSLIPRDYMDLALDKKLAPTQNALVNPNDLVQFDLTIYNQGTLPASQIQVKDYVDLTQFKPLFIGDNPSGTTTGSVSLPYSWNATTQTVSFVGVLPPNSSFRLPVFLQVRPDATNNPAINKAEIAFFVGGRDIDSTPDALDGNTSGEVAPALEDDQILEDGTATNDEDDHDFALVSISNGATCNLTVDFQGICNDNNTTNDATDDTFTFTAYTVGTGGGLTYEMTGDVNASGLQYNSTVGGFGTFPIEVGLLNLTLTDSNNPACTLQTMVIAPDDCSDLTDVEVDMDPFCKMDAPRLTATCSDNGTPNNAADDVFSYTAYVTSRNSTTGYIISGDDSRGGLRYGVTEGAFGTFPISGGNLSLLFTDNTFPRCRNRGTVIAPATCSNQTSTCSINPPIVSVACVNNGTPNLPTDDRFNYTISVSGNQTSSTYAISGGDTRSGLQYGSTYSSLQSYPISNGGFTLNIADEGIAGCSTQVFVPASGTCSASGLSADLRLSKSVDKSTYLIGDILTYTLSLVNDGPNDAQNITVQEVLPTGTTLIGATPSIGTVNIGGGTWFIPTLNNGATANLIIQVRVN